MQIYRIKIRIQNKNEVIRHYQIPQYAKNISDNKILKQKNAPIHTNWCIQYRSNVNYTFTLPCQQ